MKRLYRSRKNRVIAGVCGGIAEYFSLDPVLVRIIAILFLFVGGGSLLAYIIGIIVIPNEPKAAAIPVEPAGSQDPIFVSGGEKAGQTGGLIAGFILILLGAMFLVRNIPFFHHYYWWFWNLGWNFFWPSMLIAIGLLIIFRAARNSQNG